jgi:anti-sigma factor RsiW
MNHELIQQKLMALYDGPLTEEERKLVEGHLAGCSSCRRAVAEWKVISQGLFTSPTFSEAREDYFVAKVMDRVKSTTPETGFALWRPTLKWLVPLVGSAAMAAWAFASILPLSDFSSGSSLESAFSNTSSYTVRSSNGITMASYSSSDEFAP